jgi:hypothetical protein
MTEPLTINQTAVRLGISERTLRRRIKDGKVKARKVPCEGGGTQLLIEVDSVPDKLPTVPDTRVGQSDSVPDTANGEVLSLLKSENAFLRSMLEARERDAAELRSALREALKAMPRAITSGNESTPIEAAQSVQSTQVNQTTPPTKQSVSRGTKRQKLTAWQRIAARLFRIR